MIQRRGLSHLLLGVTLIGGVLSDPLAAAPPDNNQAIERLVEGQRQLDRVAWSHRIWPDSNPEQKPAFDTGVPVAATREKVLETRRLVAALSSYWHDPISSAELQRELTRMTRNSKDPGRLVERFEALNHDPQLIYALIVEPVLAARRARLAFERDPRSFAQQKAQLTQQLRRANNRFSGTRWMKVTRDRVDDEPWREHKTAMPAPLTAILDQWPEPLDLKETTESFYVRLSAERSERSQTDWEAVWPKQRFDDWWAQHSNEFETESRLAEEQLTLPAIDGTSGCAPGTWEYIASNPPDPRFGMFTVWTGTELLVWGGGNDLDYFTGGGRYDPATDTWSQISSGTGAPSGRVQGTAVWTGREMIVWGGRYTFTITSGYNTGGRYDPVLDRWTPTTTVNAPTQRYRHSAVWTGSEMIVWGGRSQETGSVRTGARYNPVTDTWTPTAIDANTPTARTRPAVTWAGTAMFVWGGVSGGYLQDGALYDPALDSWQTLSTGGAPAGRDGGLAVWSGTEVIVWGGASALAHNDGGRYRVSTQSWAPISTVGAPIGRQFHAMVWTGSTMMTWGGFDGTATIQYGDGGSYDPSSDSWTPIVGDASVIGPSAEAAIAWSGTELLVWGGRGEGIGAGIGGRGGRYNPNTGVWTPMGGRGLAPGRRFWFSRVWDGNEILIWGGGDTAFPNYSAYADGFTYDPATDSWSPINISGAPEPRHSHTSVWTGRELIVWGGKNSVGTRLADGGRFDPATNAWSLIPVSASSPSARDSHTATWTGTEMVIWGGLDKTGARFKPSDSTWAPTAVTTTTPRERAGHTAVWDGTGMIVYGGEFVDFTTGATNARYFPATDSWLALAEPPPMQSGYRRDHAAVWDGHRMLVWGGYGGSSTGTLGDGLAYDPQTDSWTTIATGANTPSPRREMLYAWDGESLMIWGGSNYPVTPFVADGSRYVSTSDSWLPIAAASGVPEARADNASVFSGARLYVWGGYRIGTGVGQGATYCRCAGTTIYRDADGDGAGNPSLSQASCVVPPGYATVSGDCNDADSSIYPGADEICDSLDNNCDQVVDNVPVPILVRGLQVSEGLISWDAVSTATHYDVVRGDIALLLSSAGDFAQSQVSCVADNSPATSITDLQSPDIGAAAYYLSRAQNCGGAGSYDEPIGRQLGARDSEIAASAGACP